MNYAAKNLMNSLYGRFGMSDNLKTMKIYTREEYLDMISNADSNNLQSLISDVMDLDEYFITLVDANSIDNDLNSSFSNKNISVAISAAIAAEARVEMSKFKNNPHLQLFYTDTDSIFTTLEPEEMNKQFKDIVDNKELGKLKLEHIIDKAIFLAPKSYYLELENGEKIVKIKGLNKNVIKSKIETELTFDKFYELMESDKSIDITQSKWFRNKYEGTINILEQSYNIKMNENKREFIYLDNKISETKPIYINNDIKIDYPDNGPNPMKFPFLTSVESYSDQKPLSHCMWHSL